MNYQRIYDEFIAARQLNVPSRPYDRHHIVPRCLGGTDDRANIVALTPADHLFAHVLLAKIHGGALAYGVYLMLKRERYQGRRSRTTYSWLRQLASIEQSRRVKEANQRRGHSSRLGIKHRPESIEKMRQNRAGIPRSDEAKERSAAATRGRKQSPEHVAKRVASRVKTLLAKRERGEYKQSPEHVAKRMAAIRQSRLKKAVS